MAYIVFLLMLLWKSENPIGVKNLFVINLILTESGAGIIGSLIRLCLT